MAKIVISSFRSKVEMMRTAKHRLLLAIVLASQRIITMALRYLF